MKWYESLGCEVRKNSPGYEILECWLGLHALRLQGVSLYGFRL